MSRNKFDPNGCARCGRTECRVTYWFKQYTMAKREARGRAFDQKPLPPMQVEAIRNAQSDRPWCQSQFADFVCSRDPKHAGMHVAPFEAGETNQVEGIWSERELRIEDSYLVAKRNCLSYPEIDWRAEYFKLRGKI